MSKSRLFEIQYGQVHVTHNLHLNPQSIKFGYFSGLYEAARLEKVWEKYGREMSLLKGLEPTQNFTIQVQHYHEVIAEAQIVAIENLKHIDSKCTNYWTLFNAFYFSATGKLHGLMIKWAHLPDGHFIRFPHGAA